MSRYDVKVEQGALVISCPMAIDKVAAREFFDLFQGWMMRSEETVVIDFTRTRSVDRLFYQNLIQLKSVLKENSKNLFTLHVAPALLKEIKASGMEGVFTPIDKLEKALAKKIESSVEKKGGVVLDFVQPFLAATKKVIEVQCHTSAQPSVPKIRERNSENVAIVGMIELESKGSRGRFLLSMNREAFFEVYQNMLGEKVDSIGKDESDAVSEIVNIIYGQAKIELNKRGFAFDRAFPSVFYGDTLPSCHFAIGQAVVLAFTTPAGIVEVDIEFSKVGS